MDQVAFRKSCTWIFLVRPSIKFEIKFVNKVLAGRGRRERLRNWLVLNLKAKECERKKKKNSVPKTAESSDSSESFFEAESSKSILLRRSKILEGVNRCLRLSADRNLRPIHMTSCLGRVVKQEHRYTLWAIVQTARRTWKPQRGKSIFMFEAIEGRWALKFYLAIFLRKE
jgi:hypothetical protein